MTNDPFESIDAGGIVLTANKRLSRQLVRLYDQRQMAAGLSAWSSATILSLDAWLLKQLQDLDLSGALLTDAQSQRVWEEIVAADAAAAGRDLLQVPQAARRAREAHRLLAGYLTDFREAEADEDHLAFLRWRRNWNARREANRWLDRADVLPTVIKAIAEVRCAVPASLVLAGFDDLTPAVQLLNAALAARGCRVESWEPPRVPAGRIGAYEAADVEGEVRTCARWVRRHLERDPQAAIGVVVPQLPGEYQGLIERVFRAELDPAACLPGGDGPEAFTLSFGTPLAREGIVCAALRLLAVSDPVRLEEIGWLLRSPYLGGARDEAQLRARTDRDLRARGRNEWRLAALVRALGGVPRMAAVFTQVLEASRDNRRRLPGEWAETFARLLDDCGWPGDRGLTSREFQAREHFKETLGLLASLDRTAQPLARGETLAILGRMASETIFQPEGSEGPVQVLGMLEAAGFEFDGLWILGLHEGAFPAPARPNPFLPLAVQSRLKMPHADAFREREFAGRLARRLFAAAREVVASWPGTSDGQPQRLSPLLAGLPSVQPELAPSCDPLLAVQAAPCRCETVIDDQAAPLPGDRPFAGGTGILKDQALCPFRAFGHHRLHAQCLDSPDIGLDSMTRGSLLHGVLERFWKEVGSHAALLELDLPAKTALLSAAAEATVQQHERRSRSDLPQRLRVLECRQLVAMATVWLEVERRRTPFRIAEIERRHESRAGRLLLRTRIDRIDELGDGTLAIIDYKTGRPDHRQWLDLRVTEPQLPLYCLDLDDCRVGAVLFALVRGKEKECAFCGVAREPDAWPGMNGRNQERLLSERGLHSFDEVLAHWRTALPALGDAFIGGSAAVDPVDPRLACKYCDLMTLCRIGTLPDYDESAGEGGDGDE